MIKLIHLDLDGTLLIDHVWISKENQRAIAYAKEKGVYVGLNTGRSYLSAAAFSRLAGMNAPVVCSNGAVIQDESRLYDVSFLPDQMVERVARICEETGVPFHAFSPNGYYACGKSRQNDLIESWNQEAQAQIMRGLVYCDTFSELESIAGGTIVKITISSLNPKEMAAIHRRITAFTDWEVAFSMGCMIEITHLGVNKGSGLVRLCQLLHIPKEQVLAIGDDRNDLSMFRAAGRSIAMGGCDPMVIAAADEVTEPCHQNGVATAIYRSLEAGA